MVKPNQINSPTLPWFDHVFESLLKLFWILKITPYYVTYNDKGDISLKSYVWTKLVCGSIAIFSMGVICFYVIIPLSHVSVRSPTILFIVAPDLGDAILCFLFWYVIWARQKEITDLISPTYLRNCLKWRINPTPTVVPGAQQKKRHFPTIMLSIVFVWTNYFSYVVLTYGEISYYLSEMKIEADYVISFMFEMIRFSLGLEPNLRAPRPFKETSYFEIIFVSVLNVFSLAGKVNTGFAMLLCLVGAFLFYKNTIEFNEFLRRETDETKVLQALDAFRENIDLINRVIGPIMFGIAILCAPTFMVANFARVLTSWGFATFNILFRSIAYTVILNTAAEASIKAREINEWILGQRESKRKDELFGIYIELYQNPIGLQGTECLTITYTFLAKMYGAVANFAIILLQFAQGEKDVPYLPKTAT